MSDAAASPAPPDNELSETLEMIATVVASVSDRVDDQTTVLDRVNKTAAETRQAAFAARSQTDPMQQAAQFEKAVMTLVKSTINEQAHLTLEIQKLMNATQKVLLKAEEDRTADRRSVREREQRLDRVTSYWPLFGLGVLVFALAMTFTLPRFMANYPALCAALGGTWTTTTAAVDVCAFYRK